ncbi:MAG: helix-turn-helix domain-containing protein [Patescibacteria group bacterium]
MSQNNQAKQYFSTTEVAKIMRISPEAVLKKIKIGRLKAVKVGYSYIITKPDLDVVLGFLVSSEQKDEIRGVVKKAVKEYKIAFERLGKEE